MENSQLSVMNKAPLQDLESSPIPFSHDSFTPIPEDLDDISKILRHHSSDVDACASILRHYIPILFAKKLAKVKAAKENGTCYVPIFLEMLEKTAFLIPNIFAFHKEPLYYIACRIMRDHLSVVEALQFTLRPEFRKKVMEPIPCSVRYHEFVEGIRQRLTPLPTMSRAEEKRCIPDTKKWLSLHLRAITQMAHEVVLENDACNHLNIDNHSPQSKEDLDKKALQLLRLVDDGSSFDVKSIAFQIMDTSFVDFPEMIRGMTLHPIKHAKEVYHFYESCDFTWLKEGKDRERNILRFEAIKDSFHPERKHGTFKPFSDLIATSGSTFMFKNQERRDSLLAYHFIHLKQKLKAIIQISDASCKIDVSQILSPLRDFIELTWAAEIMHFHDSFSLREYTLAEINFCLSKAPEEVLYYLVRAIYSSPNHFRILSLILSLPHAGLSMQYTSNNPPKEQYESFARGLRNVLQETKEARDVVDFMQEKFIPTLTVSMAACMWENLRQQSCLEFAKQLLQDETAVCGLGTHQSQICALACSIRDVERILELPPAVEEAMLKNGWKCEQNMKTPEDEPFMENMKLFHFK